MESTANCKLGRHRLDLVVGINGRHEKGSAYYQHTLQHGTQLNEAHLAELV